MKNSINRLLIALIIVAAVALPAFSQSGISKDSNQITAPSGNASEVRPETITGRITKLDTNSGQFSVRSGANGKVVDLLASKDIDTKSMRRGERVIVTFAQGIALKVEATRNEK
jgi:hypothetical protein